MRLAPFLLVAVALPALAQHDITQVEPAMPDSAIATPIPTKRGYRRYDIPDLAGARQAIGPQLIDGRLPRPLVDFITAEGDVEQRLSIFDGGLVVVKMTGAVSIRKKVIIPDGALNEYLKSVSAATLSKIDGRDLAPPEPDRRSLLRLYADDGTFVERVYNPTRMLPSAMNDHVAPFRDLLRAVSEDRSVTSSVAGYEPKAGDELVADDQKVYRVMRVIEGAGVVELQCLDAPTTIYVKKSDMHLYFIGAKPQKQ
jgi:hypothetical protein